MLQQCLPFTVLKQFNNWNRAIYKAVVATVLTVYGIETVHLQNGYAFVHSQWQQCLPFTVLKPHGVASAA